MFAGKALSIYFSLLGISGQSEAVDMYVFSTRCILIKNAALFVGSWRCVDEPLVFVQDYVFGFNDLT